MCERCVGLEKHAEVPSGAGRRSACVHLANEMSHGEDGAGEGASEEASSLAAAAG